MKYNLEQILTISKNMRIYGGSFVKAIAEAMRVADAINLLKLQRAFPEYFEQYLNM